MPYIIADPCPHNRAPVMCLNLRALVLIVHYILIGSQIPVAIDAKAISIQLAMWAEWALQGDKGRGFPKSCKHPLKVNIIWVQCNRSKKEKLLKDLFDTLQFHSNVSKKETADTIIKLQKAKLHPEFRISLFRCLIWSFWSPSSINALYFSILLSLRKKMLHCVRGKWRGRKRNLCWAQQL